MKALILIAFVAFIIFLVAGTFYRLGRLVGTLMERCRNGAKRFSVRAVK